MLLLKKMNTGSGVKCLHLAMGGLVFTQLLFPSISWATDVYLIYAGRDKKEKNKLLQTFSNDLNVKTYNADLLAVADYSGKQKAIAKFERADIIVTLNERPLLLLDEAKVRSYLLIVNSNRMSLRSKAHSIHILEKSMDRSRFGNDRSFMEVSSENDLADGEKLKSIHVLIVDQDSINLYRVVASIASKLLL